MYSTTILSKHGWNIPATVYMPEHKDHLPFVVMIHGTASSKEEVCDGYVKMGKTLAENGIAAIAFDAVGNGESDQSYIHYTITNDVDDTISCMEYMRSLPQIDASRVGLLGWSQGGTVAMITAGRLNEGKEIRSLVTWAGAPDLSDMFADQYEEAKEKGSTIWQFGFRSPLTASFEWYQQARDIKTLQELQPYQGPCLAIAGTTDTEVNPNEIYNICNHITNPLKEAFLLEGADHCYNLLSGETEKFDIIVGKTLNWFKETL